MAQIEINIDNYLSEEEKKELAVEVFKEQVKKELFKSSDGTVQSDSEIQRVIGNISHQIVMNEVQKHIPDCEQMIKEKTLKLITESNFSYQLFKVKNAWDKEESLAITYMNETMRSSKELFQSKIKEAIANYDPSKEISTQISETFAEMSDTIYRLSELFQNKSK